MMGVSTKSSILCGAIFVISMLGLEFYAGSRVGLMVRRVVPVVIPGSPAGLSRRAFARLGDGHVSFLTEAQAEERVAAGEATALYQITLTSAVSRPAFWAPVREIQSVRALFQAYPGGAPVDGPTGSTLLTAWLDHAGLGASDASNGTVLAMIRGASIRNGSLRTAHERVFWPGWVHNTISAVSFAGMVLCARWPRLLLPSVRRSDRLARGLCPKCRYDIRALGGTRCPECGCQLEGAGQPEADSSR